MTGQVDDPDLSVRIADRQQELEKKSVQELTVAERLTIRAMERRETLELDSEAGSIEIVFRLPLAAETQEIQELQKNALKMGIEARHKKMQMISLQEDISGEDLDRELESAQQELETLQTRASATYHRLLVIIADLCIDDSITVEFLESGLFAPEDLGGITSGILKSSQERANEGRSFRPK